MNKELYSFIVETEREIEKKEVTEKDGESITVTKKVKESVPTTIIIKKPNRRLSDEADLYKAQKMSECIKRGIVTKQMLTKKYADIGGVLSEADSKNLLGKYEKIATLNMELGKLTVKKVLTAADKKSLTKVVRESNELRREVADIESNHSHLFENTADVISLKAEILYYTLMLTHTKESEGEDVVYKPFFAGDTFEDKIESYYDLEDDPTPLYLKTVTKLTYLISFWRNGAALSQEDFEQIEKDIDEGLI